MMVEPDAPAMWRASRAGMHFGPLLASFQCFANPTTHIVDGVVRSLGCLPAGTSPQGFLLPLGDGVAFWIGLSCVAALPHGRASVEARRDGGTWFRAATLDEPGRLSVPGMHRPDGRFDTFCATSTAQLRLCAGDDCASVFLVDPESFAVRTGETPPGPLDAADGYGGWLLP